MASATIVSVWKSPDGQTAYASARVAEGGSTGAVEYLASVPALDSQGTPKTQAQLKTDLTAALAVVRQAQLAAPAAVAGISGAITL
jgi:hypothetical protein